MQAWTHDICIREHYQDIRDEVAMARLVSEIARSDEQVAPGRNLAFALFGRTLRTSAQLSRRIVGWVTQGNVRVEEQY